MGYLVKMPKMGMGMTEGTLLEWFVDVGDVVESEQVLAEFEAEKATAEIAAMEDGVLRQIYVAEGDTVDPGTVLAIVAAADEAISDLEAAVDRDSVETVGGSSAETAASATESVAGRKSATGMSPDPAGESGSVRASPRARKRAQELSVELTTISGSGPEGAITVEDVEAAMADAGDATSSGAEVATESEMKATPKARKYARGRGIDIASVNGSGPKGAVTVADLESVDEASTEAPGISGTTSTSSKETPASGERSITERRELKGMRKTIADRLGRSYREAVHVPVQREINVEDALAAVDIVEEYIGADASVMDIVLLALSESLESHPGFNATFEDGTYTVYREQHVGIAIDGERGLVTPVLRNLGERSLESLVVERHDVTQLALSGDYSSSDLTGGTFTVTNLGVLGVDFFAPIINPPEIAILSVGRMSEKPVRTDSGVAFERTITAGLTFDHRVVDGADAARFLNTFAEILEDPWPTILDNA